MKFAHLADIHIGAWREQAIRVLPLQAFAQTVERCISEKVDFILISGDIFNTSLPPLDDLKETVRLLGKVKKEMIPVYIIPGSHDFSPSGKTMIDVLEEAGLWTNVTKGEEKEGKLALKFTVDPKTGAKITGLLGRKAGLDKSYYELLDRGSLEKEEGFKIFLFHAAITEMKPKDLKDMESQPISMLPKGFDYYAGGHVHIIEDLKLEGYPLVVYPGPLFPNSFSELEKLGKGGFCMFTDGVFERISLELHKTLSFQLDCNGKSAVEVEQELRRLITPDVKDAIITLRLAGELSEGKTTDIGFRDILDEFTAQGAYVVMKNAGGVVSKGFSALTVQSGSVEEVENRIMSEHLGQIPLDGSHGDEKSFVLELMNLLNTGKQEGETQSTYEERLFMLLKHISP